MLKTKNLFIALVGITIYCVFAVNLSYSQVTDYDGNVYKTVKIGEQEWMAENLNVYHYRNGDVIPQVNNAKEWSKLTTGAWSYYYNNSENGKAYGKLYNWYAVNDARGLAPDGWHIPTDEEWQILSDFLGGDDVAGGKLKGTTLWESPNEGATNESGFTAFPGGYRKNSGNFDGISEVGSFWSASENSSDHARNRSLFYDYSKLIRYDVDKHFGFTLRCVRD